MRKVPVLILFAWLAHPCLSQMANYRLRNQVDTFTVKNILSSVNLYYGLELGEKRQTADIVDTLLHDIPFSDSLNQFNLVIIAVKELGIKNKHHIYLEDILDSAQRQGYTLCPPQVAAEILIHTQNMPHDKSLFTSKVADGTEIFIGMNPVTHSIDAHKKHARKEDIKKGKFFDYVFCIKQDPKKKDLALGYTKSDSSKLMEIYFWTSNDYFVFINKKS